MSQEAPVYKSTRDPTNKDNIDLHVRRFRDAAPTDVDFSTLYETEEWHKDHLRLEDMNVTRFHMDVRAQRAIHALQVKLIDEPYEAFGKTQGSWDNYTLMFRNGWSSEGDKRKPVTPEFQEYAESIYRPLMCTMLFGRAAWESLKRHWGSFKSCTIKVCNGDTNFLGQNVFHQHIDGRIGLRQEKNYAQRRMSRLLFSIVTDTLDNAENAGAREYGTTVYPIWQPRLGFANNHAFHAYMMSKYAEVGLKNSGLPRPHYAMPEELIYRAVSGEVLFHFTHSDGKSGPQAIHSEPNPCPDRHLFVFDWNNIVSKGSDGKFLPSIDVPEDDIIEAMLPLETYGSARYKERERDVIQHATELMESTEDERVRFILADTIKLFE